MSNAHNGRREFIRSAIQASCVSAFGKPGASSALEYGRLELGRRAGNSCEPSRLFNGAYEGARLSQIAFPMGGIGAGMICLEGAGALSKFSLRNHPNLANEPVVFAALSIKRPERIARILEGPVPSWKLRPQFSGFGVPPEAAAVWGLPRFLHAMFEAHFPFAKLRLRDGKMPVEVEITGWSPFSPGDVDNSSLPVAAVEYKFSNESHESIEAIFSFNAENFLAPRVDPFGTGQMSLDRIESIERGFVLYDPGADGQPWDAAHCAIWVGDSDAKVNCEWFSGGAGQFDCVRMVWNDIAAGKCYERAASAAAPSVGASIFVPFFLSSGQTRTITLYIAWYVPNSNLHAPNVTISRGKLVRAPDVSEHYRPWYAGRFANIDDIRSYWSSHYSSLRQAAEKFAVSFYDCTLPPEVVEAVAANLTILKSPTVLRQVDGRLWAWEGSGEDMGVGGPGSCTHVWNYSQAMPNLFPDLERSLRETEFGANQGDDGFQAHRAALPIRNIGDTDDGRYLPAAADGQLGGIIKVYREWRISGDTLWLRGLWPKVRASLDYCITTWDPARRGCVEEPHLNTYDTIFWGADCLCTGIYVGALKAAVLMGTALEDNVNEYSELLARAVRVMEEDLFNGEYFFQRVNWWSLQARFPPENGLLAEMFPIAFDGLDVAQKEGPPYQVGTGCLSDGMLGAWLCFISGVGDVLERGKVESHLMAVRRNNLKMNLTDYPQVGRSFLATGGEAGLLVCTWPRGGRPSLPVAYADEVWTGTEYQVASHLIALGRTEEGLEIVRSTRLRYDGDVRNPFAEVEAGHWYARAMSSYALLQAFSGARFDAVDKILYLHPTIKGDFRCFLSTATGFGTVGVKNGRPFLDVASGQIPYEKIAYTPV